MTTTTLIPPAQESSVPTPLAPAPAVVDSLPARMRWAAADAWTMTRRNLVHVRYVPEKLIDVTLQPVMFVLLFAYVFGDAIHVGGGNYKSFLLAGIIVQSLSFGAAGTAVGIAEDVASGAVQRFRSLPMARSAVLMGRTGSDLLATLISLSVLTASGLVVGWRAGASPASVLAGYGVLLLFAYAMSWLGVLLGTLVRAPDAAQGFAFIVLFPLSFIANSFVPLQSLPAGLRAFAEWNPLSATITAARRLFGNPDDLPRHTSWLLEHPVLGSILWTGVLLAVMIPAAMWRFRRVA